MLGVEGEAVVAGQAARDAVEQVVGEVDELAAAAAVAVEVGAVRGDVVAPWPGWTCCTMPRSQSASSVR
jgi:hypothetical protein